MSIRQAARFPQICNACDYKRTQIELFLAFGLHGQVQNNLTEIRTDLKTLKE